MTTTTATNRFADATTRRQVVGELAGAASMCWAHVERAGMYQPDAAVTLVDEAVTRLAELDNEELRPLLGHASTEELLGELWARTDPAGVGAHPCANGTAYALLADVGDVLRAQDGALAYRTVDA